MYILVPLAAVVCVIGWSVLDYHRGRPISVDVNRQRRSERVKFCLQVAVAAPAISVGLYAADAAGIAKGHIGLALAIMFWSGAGISHWLRSRRRQATHPPE
jgi:hypothetical protein